MPLLPGGSGLAVGRRQRRIGAGNSGKERLEEAECVAMGVELAAEDRTAVPGVGVLGTFGNRDLVKLAVRHVPQWLVRTGEAHTDRGKLVVVMRPDPAFVLKGDRNHNSGFWNKPSQRTRPKSRLHTLPV